MRIEAVNLSGEVYASMGVGMPTLPMDDPLQLQNLGQCVVIAGKNGSGKTRLLTLLEQIATRYVSPELRRQSLYQIAQNQEIQKANRAAAERLEAQPKNGDPPGQAEELRRQVAATQTEIDRLQTTLQISDALIISGEGTPKIVAFVPKSTKLEDPSEGRENEAIQRAQTFSTALVAQGSSSGAPAYARHVMRAATNERGARRPGAGTSKHDEESGLLEMLSSLLGDEVRFVLNDSQNLQLDGLTDRYDSLLSDGQKVLFQLACMLHARQTSLKDCIIFLDEPENHLHPAVLNDLVNRLLALLTDGQLWIATHSVPLIAHLVAKDPNCLWFAENGIFKPSGRTPFKVLDSLLGGPVGAQHVNELTLLPSRFASFLLLRQCLLPPGVISYSDGDPQLEQIRQVLAKIRPDRRPLSVLDFGAGKGRLLDALADAQVESALGEVLDYVAYEPREQDAELCRLHSTELYRPEAGVSRAFSDLDALREARGEKFADVAIVCNVLHEVEPSKWLEEFGGSSKLAKLLRDEGFVLFVEDYAIPVGERANQYGFLLLDEPEIALLFGVSEEDIAKGRFTRNDHTKKKYQGRLIAHFVSAQCLARMSDQTRWNAINCLHGRSLDRLKTLLGQEHTAETGSELGRESALVTQLVANSALWLRDNRDDK